MNEFDQDIDRWAIASLWPHSATRRERKYVPRLVSGQICPQVDQICAQVGQICAPGWSNMCPGWSNMCPGWSNMCPRLVKFVPQVGQICAPGWSNMCQGCYTLIPTFLFGIIINHGLYILLILHYCPNYFFTEFL